MPAGKDGISQAVISSLFLSPPKKPRVFIFSHLYFITKLKMLKCLLLFSSVTKRDVQQVDPTEICEVAMRMPETVENLKNHKLKVEI